MHNFDSFASSLQRSSKPFILIARDIIFELIINTLPVINNRLPNIRTGSASPLGRLQCLIPTCDIRARTPTQKEQRLTNSVPVHVGRHRRPPAFNHGLGTHLILYPLSTPFLPRSLQYHRETISAAALSNLSCISEQGIKTDHLGRDHQL